MIFKRAQRLGKLSTVGRIREMDFKRFHKKCSSSRHCEAICENDGGHENKIDTGMFTAETRVSARVDAGNLFAIMWCVWL